MKPLSFTEYLVLGSLMSGERHGYEIIQFLGSTLDATWRMSTSQLYVLLKRLQQEGWLSSRSKIQASRPSKRIFNLTIGGRKAFLDWLAAPVEHVRDFRMEFLCKMFFFDHLSLPGAKDLVEEQIRVLERLSEKIRGKTGEGETRFIKLVYGFKVRTVEGLLSWLVHEARPFAEGEELSGSRQ